MKRLKLLLLLSSCALLLIFALFPKPFLLKAMDWKLSKSIRDEFGGEFYFETLAWESGRITFKKVRLHKPFHFDAKCEEVSYSFSKNELRLSDLNLILCKRGDFPLEQFAHVLDMPAFQTYVTGGKLLLYDYTGEGPLFQKVDWNLSGNHFEMCLGGSSQPIQVNILRQEERFQLKGEISHEPLSSLFNFGRYFCSEALSEQDCSWQFSGGDLSATIAIVLEKKKWKEILGEVSLQNLRGHNRRSKFECRLDQLHGSLDFDLGNSSLCNGAIDLSGGVFSLNKGEESTVENPWDLQIFNSSIQIEQGKVESSKMNAAFLGMQGEMALHTEFGYPLLSVKFKGSSQNMLPLIPQTIQKAFEKAFPEDDFFLSATIKKNPLGLSLEGVLDVVDRYGETSDLAWGCHFATCEKKANQTTPLLQDLKEQFTVSEKRVGWLRGNHFLVEKFLSPFLFREKNLQLAGRVDFEGSFDERFLTIYYKGKGFSFEGPHFVVKVDSLDTGISSDVVAVHYFDFKNWDHVGFCPVQNARFYQKNPQFSLENASFLAYFENRKIEMRNITTQTENLKFKGEMKVSLPKNEPVELLIQTTGVTGDLLSARNFLSKFFPSFLLKMPLGGKVESGPEDVMLRFLFNPKSKLVEGHVRGKMIGECKSHFASLSDYKLHFDYDRKLNRLLLHKGEGFLDFKNTRFEFTTPEILVSDFPHPLVTGAAYIKKEGKELYNILGSYQKEKLLEVGGNLLTMKGIHQDNHLALDEFAVGKVKGSANIDWKHDDVLLSLSDVKVEEAHSFSLKGQFKKGMNLRKGLILEGLNLSSADGKSSYQLDALRCNLQNQKLSFQDFAFCLTQERLPLIRSFTDSFFPGKVPAELFEWIEMQKNPIEGRVSFEIHPSATSAHLSLKDGLYTAYGKDHELRNIAFFYDPGVLRLSGEVFYQEQFYPVSMSSKGMKEGNISLKEHPASQDALIGYWKRSPGGKIDFERVQGKFCGLDVFLHKQAGSENQALYLGKIHFDGMKLCKLLPPPWKNKVQKLEIGSGYSLEGEFDFFEKKFSGMLLGNHFSFWGMELDSLSSVINCTPKKIELKHLVMEDWGGKVEVEKASLIQQEGTWEILVPQLMVKDVRPIRLKGEEGKKNKKGFFDPLCIQSFQLNHFEGTLGERTSFKGNGALEFSNIPKKNFLSSLLFLPKEITARIGLDLSLLIPARGAIHYEIHDGKVFLTKLKNVFSEGKRSRFYLAEGHPATIDFDGHLNVKVKMKQYNLLMKVAEFFVVTVRGDIFKPTFSLNHQQEYVSDDIEMD